MSTIDSIEMPVNEPVRAYSPATPEGQVQRAQLTARLNALASEKIEIPLVIGGQEIRTGNTRKVVMPHAHGHVLAEFHLAGARELELAVEASKKAKAAWEALPWQERAGVFLKAAELLAGPWRDTLNAS